MATVSIQYCLNCGELDRGDHVYPCTKAENPDAIEAIVNRVFDDHRAGEGEIVLPPIPRRS